MGSDHDYPSLANTPTPLRRYRPAGRNLLTILFVVVIIGFTAVQLSQLIIGPTITFSDHLYTAGYNQTTDNIITVSGTTNRVAYFYLNDTETAIQDNGAFDFDLYIPYGDATIDIRIKDRYGRQKTTQLAVHNPNQPLDPNLREEIARPIISTVNNL